MGNIFNNVKQVWQTASVQNRLTLVAIAVGFLVTMGLLIHWATQPNLVLLYGDLDPTDAAKIAEKLRDEGIPHKVKDGGKTIFAPADMIHQLRLEMVTEGIPQGGADGYSILDDGGMPESPVKESMRITRAIAGELTKTISLIDGVEKARVHIVHQSRSMFTRDGQAATASVFVKTRGGARLGGQSVLAVANMVAGAVKGVTPDKVVVVVNGVTENGQQADSETGVATGLIERKMDYERRYAKDIEQMLERALGAGRASVRVIADVSYESMRKIEHKIDPNQRTERSVETRKKDVKNGGAGKSGNSSPGSQKDTSEKVEYDVPGTTTQIAVQPGEIDVVGAAVFVDFSALKEAAGEGGTVPLTVENVRTMVATRLGLDPSQTSRISVSEVPFQDVTVDDPLTDEAGWFSRDFLLEMARKASIGVLAVGMLVAFRIMRGKKPKDVVAAATADAQQPAGGQKQEKRQATLKQLKGADRALRQKITQSLTTNPDEVKQLFLSWIESSGK